MNNIQQRRLEEIKAMNYADLDQLLSTIPPLICAADIDSPVADAIPDELIASSSENICGDWEYPDEVYEWDTITGGGVYKAVGYAPIKLVAQERLFDIIRANKIVVVIGEDKGFMELVGAHGVYHFKSDVGHDLSDQEYALQLRDEIATQPIGALVLLNQQGRTQHLDLVTAVPVFRGTKVATTKRIPIFDVDTELAVWDEDKGRIEFKKDIFAKVEKPVVQHEDDRVGCVERASDIRKEHREWLWPGYLGINKVCHFGGASTEGKSPVTLDIAARVSAGLDWPDGTKNTLGPKAVILLAAEDDWSDTIVPRLEVAGANLNNIYKFSVKQKTVEITPSLDSDCQRLEEKIRQINNAVLIVIDPITNYLGSKQMNHESEIRGGILMPLATVAKNHHCSIITVGHLNKRGSEATVLQRLMGAAAFSGVARDVFIFGPDPDDEDKYSHTMTEIRNKSASQLKYRTEMVKAEWDGKTSEVIRVKWCGVTHADVDEYNRLRQQLYDLQQQAKNAEVFCNNKADGVKGLEQRINDLLRKKKQAIAEGHLGDERNCEHQLQQLETELIDAKQEFTQAKHWSVQAARALKAFDGQERIAALKKELAL